jgi:hypothetical protein
MAMSRFEVHVHVHVRVGVHQFAQYSLFRTPQLVKGSRRVHTVEVLYLSSGVPGTV